MAIIGMHALIYSRQADEVRRVFADALGWRSVDAGGSRGLQKLEDRITHHLATARAELPLQRRGLVTRLDVQRRSADLLVFSDQRGGAGLRELAASGSGGFR